VSDPARVYWDDVHLTAEGDEITAQAAADFITNAGTQ
jgi:lysophospholipase L1-like esterase